MLFDELLLNLHQGDVVLASWTDSGMSRSMGWEKPDEVRGELAGKPELLTVHTIGYYLGRLRDDSIMVAQSHDRMNDSYLNFQIIHIPNLQSIERVGDAPD